MHRVGVHGTISSAGFGTGDRVVVGVWKTSPVGPLLDVMWATPEHRRVLLAPTDAAAAFISMIYAFDEIRIGPLIGGSDGRRTHVRGQGLDLELVGGRRRAIPVSRPLAVTRWIERPIARALMGVETYGTSELGATEWYQTEGWRWVTRGRASIDGRDLGAPGPIVEPLGVGFSEPPRRPAIVAVKVTIDLPSPLVDHSFDHSFEHADGGGGRESNPPDGDRPSHPL